MLFRAVSAAPSLAAHSRTLSNPYNKAQSVWFLVSVNFTSVSLECPFLDKHAILIWTCASPLRVYSGRPGSRLHQRLRRRPSYRRRSYPNVAGAVADRADEGQRDGQH